jgi:tRNA1Val (adenine37-N6)-methyltransferase
MTKNSFTFKHFTINQDRCAMKVCTDACILGASTAVENVKNILDIGTGTGLLALMLAQRTDAKIDAVEIEENAYNQALNNVSESKFSDIITIYHQDIQSYNAANSYDLIISNPPFYQKSLKSPDTQTNKALHAVELTFDELIASVIRLLKPDGRFIVLLPPFEVEKLIQIAQKKELYLSKKILIRHDESKPVFRIIATFQNLQVLDYQEEILVIHEKDGKTYSEKFRDLLKDYYLIF